MSLGFIYLIESYTELETLYKIGYTKHENVAKKRIPGLKTGNPAQLTVRSKFATVHGRKVETALHNLYSHKNRDGEWFELENYDVANFLTTCQQIENNCTLLVVSNNPFL